jgi:hypothetical protein
MKRFVGLIFVFVFMACFVLPVFSGGQGESEKASNTQTEAWLKTAKLGKYAEETFDETALYEAAKKEGEINIIVWGDFGRNVNLNSAKGWDHGNNQNLYLFCGKNYFNHTGIVGETYLPNVGAVNRMYLKPKESSYSFEPFAVASTIYKLYGITNPKILTGGIEEIKAGLLKS